MSLLLESQSADLEKLRRVKVQKSELGCLSIQVLFSELRELRDSAPISVILSSLQFP